MEIKKRFVFGLQILIVIQNIEIYRIASDGSGALKRIDDIQGTIRAIAEEYNFERDYNISFRQHVARLIHYINTLENKQQ